MGSIFDDAFSAFDGLNVSPYNASPLPIASPSWGLGQTPDWSFDQNSTLASIKTLIASPGSSGVSAASSGPVAAGGASASSSDAPPTPKTAQDCPWYDVKCQFTTAWGNTFGGSSTGSGSSEGGSSIESYFIRAAVIILGLICIGVGLSMFGGSKINITTAAKAAAIA